MLLQNGNINGHVAYRGLYIETQLKSKFASSKLIDFLSFWVRVSLWQYSKTNHKTCLDKEHPVQLLIMYLL